MDTLYEIVRVDSDGRRRVLRGNLSKEEAEAFPRVENDRIVDILVAISTLYEIVRVDSDGRERVLRGNLSKAEAEAFPRVENDRIVDYIRGVYRYE